MSTEYDVIVVGGGPAGAVAACVLAQAGKRVALVSAPQKRPALGESLIGAARPLLAHLGLSHVVEGHEACYGNLSAWGQEQVVPTDFIHDSNGPGWHLARDRFDEALRHAAADAGATLIEARVSDASCVPGGLALTADARSLTTSRIVDATGRRSTVARKLGVQRLPDARMVAMAGWFAGAGCQDRRTWVESCELGWWYTARVSDGQRVAVLHTAPELAKGLASSAAWLSALDATRIIRDAVAGASLEVGPYGSDAGGWRLSRVAGPGWLAVGDAALSFDPLSSQGIFNALYTGMKGAEAVLGRSTVADYQRDLARVRSVYLARRWAVYGQEMRFSTAPFWANMSAPRVPVQRAG